MTQAQREVKEARDSISRLAAECERANSKVSAYEQLTAELRKKCERSELELRAARACKETQSRQTSPGVPGYYSAPAKGMTGNTVFMNIADSGENSPSEPKLKEPKTVDEFVQYFEQKGGTTSHSGIRNVPVETSTGVTRVSRIAAAGLLLTGNSEGCAAGQNPTADAQPSHGETRTIKGVPMPMLCHRVVLRMFSLELLQTMLCHRTANPLYSTPTAVGKAPLPMLCHRMVLVRRTLVKPAEALTSPSILG